MLEFDEGLRFKPYRCTAGKLTIGVGRNIDDVGISRAEAYILLDNDIARATRDCEEVFGAALWNSWGEVRRLGWVNFRFQLGKGGMLSFRNTLDHARSENWERVEKHLLASKWAAKDSPARAGRVVAMIVREEFPYED